MSRKKCQIGVGCFLQRAINYLIFIGHSNGDIKKLWLLSFPFIKHNHTIIFNYHKHNLENTNILFIALRSFQSIKCALIHFICETRRSVMTPSLIPSINLKTRTPRYIRIFCLSRDYAANISQPPILILSYSLGSRDLASATFPTYLL